MRRLLPVILALELGLLACNTGQHSRKLPYSSRDLIMLLPDAPRGLLDTLINKGALQKDPVPGIARMKQMLQDYPYSRDSLTAALLYHNIAQGYARLDNNDSMIRYFELANLFWDTHPESSKVHWVANHRLGLAYYNTGHLYKAAYLLNKAGLELDRWHSHHTLDSSELSRVYYNIATVQTEAERYETALKYIRLSQQWAAYAGADSNYERAIGWFESSRIHAGMKQFDSARYYLDLLPPFLAEFPNPEFAVALRSFRANLYYQKREFDSAAIFAKEVVATREKQDGDPNVLATARYSTAGALLEENKAGEAAPYLMQAKAYYDTTAHPLEDELTDLNENLAMYYILRGPRDSAFTYFKKTLDGKKNQYDQQRLSILSEMEAAYSLREKEESIERLSSRQRSTEERLRQRNILLLAIGTAFLLALTLAILFWTLQRQRKLKAQKEKLELEQRLLRSQMEPHFIFNTLSVLQSLIAEGRNEKSIRYLNQFARLLRLSLENSRENFVPLEDEVEALQSYVSLQQMRFDNSFDYTIEVYDGYAEEELLLPPMLLQPFVENAIQHGLRNLGQKGMLHISIRRQDRALLCVIEDNGNGAPSLPEHSQQKKSLSTIITRERLAILSQETGVPASLDVSGSRGTGTKVTLQIPFRRA